MAIQRKRSLYIKTEKSIKKGTKQIVIEMSATIKRIKNHQNDNFERNR